MRNYEIFLRDFVKGTAEVIAAAFVGNLFSLISQAKNKRKRESFIPREFN